MGIPKHSLGTSSNSFTLPRQWPAPYKTPMPLLSPLFQGDQKLEAAAAADTAHIVPGAKGEHVSKIQTALNRLDDANLKADGQYGPRTAAAVLAFKQKRNIINRSYQQSADNIVGRMTIAALDQELLASVVLKPLEITVIGGSPAPSRTAKQLSRVSSFAGARNARVASGIAANFALPVAFTRHAPGTKSTVRCDQTGGFAAAVCENLPDPSNDPPKSVNKRVVFLSDLAAPSSPSASADLKDGGQVKLTNDPHFMQLDNLHPGDAVIRVSRPDQTRVLFIDIRQGAKGPVPGAPLTKFTAGSKFFSASHTEGGEGSDPEGIFSGRPVNPKRGGRLINLGGELESPGFEDYQVDLDHSLGGHGGFRPWADDSHPSVFIPDKSASHITMRGTPLFDSFVKVIKRIAQPGCHFTFNGEASFEAKIASQIPGRQLERLPDGGFILLAWEIA